MPNQVKPVVVAFVGRESWLEAKPTWVKEPESGTMYIEIVSLKITVLELAVIVHGSVVETESVEKVTFVERSAKAGTVLPIYASPTA